MKTIEELVEEVKSREKEELIDAVRKYGKAVKEGHMVEFGEDSRPVIAGYIGDDPCDIVIKSVLVTTNGHVYLEGFDKNNIFCQYKDIEPIDIFAGHLEYVTSSIG